MPLGDSLAAAGLISHDDVAEALRKQREAGGAMGDILVGLGAISRSKLDAFLAQGPPRLGGPADTGLSDSFLRGLALKVMFAQGAKTAKNVAGAMKLPVPIVREVLESLRMRGQLESLGADGTTQRLDLRYELTAVGKDVVQQALKQSLYSGPAPVPLAQWQAQVDRQRITNDRVDKAAIAESLAGLVIAPEMVARFGPAVNAGRGILLYGAPGNGKTSVARAIALSFKQPLWVPYAIEVEDHVVKIFDPAFHRPVSEPSATNGASATNGENGTNGTNGTNGSGQAPVRLTTQVSDQDPRWVRCARPVAVVGGELTMDMLDLKFDPVGLYSEAPLHTKMTGGVLVVDDFGRQIAPPERVLNRWVLPLESRIDFLTLHTGRKFPVIFDGLVIFSTNITPRNIMDSAMMRRIPYNFHIDAPTGAEYLEIFRRVCTAAGLKFDDAAIGETMSKLYAEENLPMARFHPQFIVDHVVARCNYEGREPTLDADLLLDAAEHLYTRQ